MLDLVYTESSAEGNADFPNAIYLDAVDVGGLIRTGTVLRPLQLLYMLDKRYVLQMPRVFLEAVYVS